MSRGLEHSPSVTYTERRAGYSNTCTVYRGSLGLAWSSVREIRAQIICEMKEKAKKDKADKRIVQNKEHCFIYCIKKQALNKQICLIYHIWNLYSIIYLSYNKYHNFKIQNEKINM